MKIRALLEDDKKMHTAVEQFITKYRKAHGGNPSKEDIMKHFSAVHDKMSSTTTNAIVGKEVHTQLVQKGKKLTDPEQIAAWLDYIKVKKYTINKDNTVDVEGDVVLPRRCKHIPIQFAHVSGDFRVNIYSNISKITSLAGSPREVGGTFDCSSTSIVSLKGGPKEVGGNFHCNDNKLTSLEGAPREVGGYFYCHYNKLTSLAGAPRKVGGDFLCIDNEFKKEPDTSLIKIGGHFVW